MRAPSQRSAAFFGACLAALGFLAAPHAGAQVSLETFTSAGVLLGTSRELVFDGAYKVSELDWAMKPLVITGSELRGTWESGLRASLEVRAGVPGDTGRITDKDFLNYDGVVTHFSEHDCYTEGALLLDARIGWQFALGERFALEPFAAFSLMRFKWTARDGYLQYPPESSPPYTPWNSSITRIPVFGTGIVYEQTWYIPMAGLRATYRYGDGIEVALSLGFSPYLWMTHLDNHELRLLDFSSTLSGGLLLDPSLEVSWRLTPQARVAVDLSYRAIWGLVGDTLVSGTGVAGDTGPELDPGVSVLESNASGTSFNAFSLSVSLVLTL
jgi:outer membrane protease